MFATRSTASTAQVPEDDSKDLAVSSPRLDKLIRKFTGDDTGQTYQAWSASMRRLQKLQRRPTSDIVFHMALHLSGSGEDWVDASIFHDDDNPPTPEDFIGALERQYDQSYVANGKMRRLFQGSSVRYYNAQLSALRCQ
jgi:hypothetical protein